MTPRAAAWIRPLIVIAAVAALALVFVAYTQPSLMQHLADQLWACF